MPGKRGRPREFDVNMRVSVTRELHARVQLFAEINEMTTTAAYRVLIESAIDRFEGSEVNV